MTENLLVKKPPLILCAYLTNKLEEYCYAFLNL